MEAQPTLTPEVAEIIARCAAAMGDLDRLRAELVELRASPDSYATFATALFDLERARRGDPEARLAVLELADQLLVFWRGGTGGDLASSHPVLQELWDSASSLLISFEVKRFQKALKQCWDVRAQPALLTQAIRDLLPEGNRRVEFARCLYHLELARQFVDASRQEFAMRAGLLSEAYQSEDIANELVGDDAGLRQLWEDVKPYLDEFFEMMEEQAEKRRKRDAARTEPVPAVERGQVKTDPSLVPVPTAPPPPPQPSGIFASSDSEDVEIVADVALGEEAPVPSFRSLMKPPAAPPDLTPPGQWFPPKTPSGEIELVDIEDMGPPAPPAPPPDTTPPGSWKRPPPPPDVLDSIDVVEAPPIPPPPRPENLDITLDEPDPDAATQAFWQHSSQALDLLPDPRQPRAAKRMLNVDGRADRKRITDFLDGLGPQWHQVDDARAFSAQLRLMLAGQLKEKSLFGTPNARRAEAFSQAFALLGSNPRAAGHGATWFVLDGPETEAALHRGLDVLAKFLAFCAREQKDPLDPKSHQTFLRAGS